MTSLEMAEGFLRTATRRISSWPGEATLHKKAGYIDAGFLLLNTFPLQSDGGPYIPLQSDGGPYISVSSIGTRAADAALWLAVEILFTHSQQTGRRLALKSKYLIDPNL